VDGPGGPCEVETPGGGPGGGLAELFRADIYSQNQIEEIASVRGQLVLLDRQVEDLIGALAGDIHKRLLDSSRTPASWPLDGELEDLATSAAAVPVLEEKLRALAPCEAGCRPALPGAAARTGARRSD